MKAIVKAVARKHSSAPLALVACLAAMAPAASAAHRTDTPSEQPATVLAHVPLAGSTTIQMDLQENGGRQYLYIGANSSQGVTVVDVTNPSRPSVNRRFAWPNHASTGRLQLVSAGLALAEGPAGGSAPATSLPLPTTVNVLDMSDPANPPAVLTFAGVTSTLNDEAHNVVYITNSEGLWIVRNNAALRESAKSYTCTSDDAYNDVAGCQ